MNDYLARIAEAIERLAPIPSADPSFSTEEDGIERRPFHATASQPWG